ncbi:hypothetical protein [Sphingobium sp. WCS2017Hpa-17]|uniref:hypothetical protein n=1 Tax=Sphingobium sp. WCS2017Hpa-17 TaxID=3073638 RepID=UPI00288A008F|nr:hypothetical protein [Sphingobium sp. WCS2017Hpa-17]
MFWNKKPAEPTITMAEHVRIVAEKVGEARKDLQSSLNALQIRGNSWRDSAFKSARKIEALETELADLKAKRARSNGNLIPGGPKKKAAVMAERAGSVG